MEPRDDLLVLYRSKPLTDDEKRLAEILHGHLCPAQHDMRLCYFFLSDWDDPDYLRCHFLLKARDLLRLTNDNSKLAQKILKTLFGTS